MAASEVVQELEAYLSKQKLDDVIKQLVVHCLRDKPDDVVPYLLKVLLRLNPLMASTHAAVSSGPTDEGGGGARVAVSHDDPEAQQYLNSVQADVVLKDITVLILRDRPEDLVAYLPSAAQELKQQAPAAPPP